MESTLYPVLGTGQGKRPLSHSAVLQTGEGLPGQDRGVLEQTSPPPPPLLCASHSPLASSLRQPYEVFVLHHHIYFQLEQTDEVLVNVNY